MSEQAWAEQLTAIVQHSIWYEARLDWEADPRSIYSLEEELQLISYHHFGNEPWWPGRWVVRVRVSIDRAEEAYARIAGLPAVVELVPWFGVEDEQVLWGHAFESAMAVFYGASRTAALSSTKKIQNWNRDKFIHCILNLNGGGDFRWALRFAWGRVKLFWRFSILRQDPMKYQQRKGR